MFQMLADSTHSLINSITDADHVIDSVVDRTPADDTAHLDRVLAFQSISTQIFLVHYGHSLSPLSLHHLMFEFVFLNKAKFKCQLFVKTLLEFWAFVKHKFDSALFKHAMVPREELYELRDHARVF
jgi:hypothetical protein